MFFDFSTCLTNLLLNLTAALITNKEKLLSCFTNIALAPLANEVFLIKAASSEVLAGSC